MNQSRRDFHACLFGAFPDVPNMGCRALAASLVKLIVEEKPGARIDLLYGARRPGEKEIRLSKDKTVRARVVNFRLSPKSDPRQHMLWILFWALVCRLLPEGGLRRRVASLSPWLTSLRDADFVGEVRGGDSFADIYGFRRFFIGMLPSLSALLMRKRLVLLPQTYGPFKGALSRRLAAFIMRRAWKVVARDKTSRDVATRLLGRAAENRPVLLCPDVAFALEPIEPEEILIEPPLPVDEDTLMAGLNVSGLLYVGGYTGRNMFGLKFDYAAFVKRLARELLATPGLRLLLVPHTFGNAADNDQRVCRELWEELRLEHPDRCHLVTGTHDQHAIKAIIGRCDFFLGSRMHACIGAISQGIPAAGLAYSRKFLGVFEILGVGDMALDATQMGEEELLQSVRERLANRGDVARHLREALPETRRKLRQCFHYLLGDQ
jgi:polysaccharide pyruvyl transferase WcaK-like protein